MLKKFMITRTLASLGDSILMFALPLMIFKATGSVVYSGLAFAIEWLPRVLWLPFSGIFIDRFGGKRVLMSSDIIRALGCVIVFTVFQLDLSQNHFLVLALFSAVVALLSGQTFIALESLMRKTLLPEQMPKGQSMLEACNMISLLSGPGLGALFVTYFKVEVVFGVCAVIYALGFINLIFLQMNEVQGAVTTSLSHLAVGLKEFLGTRRLMGLALFGAMANVVYGGAMALAPAITKVTFVQSDQAYAAMVSTLGFTSVLSLMIVPVLNRKFSTEGLKLASLGVIFAGTAGMILAKSYWVFVLGFGLLLGGITILNIFVRTLRAQYVSKENFARTVSLMIMFSQLPLPLSGLMVSRLGDQWATTSILAAIGGVSLVMGIVSCLLLSEAPGVFGMKILTKKNEGAA